MPVVWRSAVLRIIQLLGGLSAAGCLAFSPLFLIPARAAEPAKEADISDEEKYGANAEGVKTPIQLNQAVTAFNQKLAEFIATERSSSDSADKPTISANPLTVEEVISAIRGWDRQKHPVVESTYQLFQKIAADKTLPPDSVFNCETLWSKRERHEQRLFLIRLSVATGKNQGYALTLRSQDLEQRPFYDNSPGYRWNVRPQPLTSRNPPFTSDLRVTLGEIDADGFDVVVKRSYDVVAAQVVVFDEQGNRFNLDRKSTGAYADFLMEQFRFDFANLARDKVATLGVETVTRNDVKTIAIMAKRRAKMQGVESLPLPVIGQAFDFSLNFDGKRVDSRKWRGKVVLIDFWGSTCIPCIAKMPELKELNAKWHDKGLEVVGVSFDDDAVNAQAVLDHLEIPWPSASILEGSEVWNLWNDRGHTTILPTVLLIDKQGILRYEIVGKAGKVADKLEELLSEAAKPGEKVEAK